MPAFSRRNREKFMLTEKTSGFARVRELLGQATYSSDKTLHRLWQIMPLVSETVNNVEFVVTTTSFADSQLEVRQKFFPVGDSLWPPRTLENISDPQQII